MEDDEERIVTNPGRIIDAASIQRNPLKEGPGRQLLRDQVRQNFRIYAEGQKEVNPAAWAALSPDKQFQQFIRHHHTDVLGSAEERGWGAFGRE